RAVAAGRFDRHATGLELDPARHQPRDLIEVARSQRLDRIERLAERSIANLNVSRRLRARSDRWQIRATTGSDYEHYE
ncbi:MAG TPA: hypothetical protein VIU61_03420, partial [Kofleriaceae bacterium]